MYALMHPSLAHSLVGRTLANGWTVEELRSRPPGATGGHFSVQYVVRHVSGQQAFLKVLDYSAALQKEDFLVAVRDMTAEYVFERDLHRRCTDAGLTRIATILDAGKIESPEAVLGRLDYLVFEWVNRDLRSAVPSTGSVDAALAMRLAHQVTAALNQLHGARIAHQDIKPSNILVPGGGTAKVTDLGRAFDGTRVLSAPHDDCAVPGDRGYAPPEQLYNAGARERSQDRFTADLYLLGNVIMFLCAGVSLNGILFQRLDRRFHPARWNDGYASVEPYLQNTFHGIVSDLRKRLHPTMATDLTAIVQQLCALNPDRRGHPKTLQHRSGPALERYVTKFDLLARRAQMHLAGQPLMKEALN